MEHKLRILLNCNAPWSTSGYGVQTELLSSRIKGEGYPLALVNFYGQEGGMLRINDIPMYPRMTSAWGDDAMVYHGQDFKTDVSMTLQDIWTLDPNLIQRMNRWIPIIPIDHDPPPSHIIDRLRMAYRIVTYAKFGHEQLAKLGMFSTYIPHGVDTDVFKPMDNKAELRKKFNLPVDSYIFGMVAANKDNPPRKSFQEAIDAFKLFHDKYPKSAMYFHTFLQQQGGFPIETYWNFIGLPKEKLFFLQPYDLMFHCGRKEMAQIYNCLDCLLLPSTNEGFGVPAIEAQACGVPVIVNDFTAMPELIIDRITGRKCKVAYKRFSPLGSFVGVPDVNDMVSCMDDVSKKDQEKVKTACREWVMRNYDINLIYKEKWSPFLKNLENEVYPN